MTDDNIREDYNKEIAPKMEFQIEITETLQKTITVEAINLEDALMKARSQYENETIVLDSDDFVDVEFDISEEE